MSEQEREPGEAPDASEPGSQQSRFIPGGLIEADEIKATNVANVQHIAEQHIHLPGQKYVPPLQLPRRAEHFQDRMSERAWLLAHLHPGQIVTLCGPGGMGKTALVAELLWTLAPSGTAPTAFPHGIVFHSFYGRPEAAVALEQLARTFGEDPLPTPAEAARRALGGKRALLVLDGAEEAQDLEQVLAVCASCAVLVTSRRRSDAADPALLLDLQRLPQEDAVTVVQAWQAQRQTPAAVIERICQLVGGLPLALRLVGSYLALHPNEAEDYLAWLEEDVWQALDQGNSTHKSVPVLLERSLARLSSDAQTVLEVIGLFALAPFERELIAGVLKLAARATSRALDELVDYGLLVQVGKAYEVSHPLIHTYARQVLLARQVGTQQRLLVERFIKVLAEHFPEVTHTNWAICERLVPHIQACTLFINQYGVVLEAAASLFNQTGWYLVECVRYAEAEPLLQQALVIAEEQLGPDHLDTAVFCGYLGLFYLIQGKYVQAESLFLRALAIREKVLPSEHSAIAVGLHNLAQLYQIQGRYEEAELLLQRAFAIDEKVLIPDHPNSAAGLHNLAQLYQIQGRYEEAELLLQRALAINEKVLVPDHPSTAIILNNLAQLYKTQERYEEAESLYQRALTIKEKVLPLVHPSTAATLDNLGQLYQTQGWYEEAEPLFLRSLAIKEKVLPTDHPETATALNNLGQLYWKQGRYEEAEPLYRRALAIKEQALGPDHSETAITLNDLAVLYQDQGKYEQAEPLYQRSLAITEKVLGPDHSLTAIALENYASLLRKTQRTAEGITLEQRAQAIHAKRSSLKRTG